MEQDPDSPPTFWFQPPTATNRRRKPPIDPVVLIILIPILALIFLFFFLPPFLSHASHILKPGSVKSTWDSLNIFLVLFAILCGVLARQNDDASSSSSSDVSNGYVAESSNNNNNININVNPSDQWVGYSHRNVGTGGLRRNSSSYPNLRHESVWENVGNHNRSRYFDDFNLYSSPVNRYYNDGDVYRRSHRSEADPVELSDEKEIFVDTFEVSPNIQDFHEQKPPATPPPPPPPPPPPSAPSRHSFRSVAKNASVKVKAPPVTEADVLDEMRSLTPLSPPSLPSPPRPPVHRSRHKHKKLERKVSDATKEIATAISSLYNQRKKKNKRKLRSISTTSDTSPPSVQQPPPPPPPPPPPYRFQNLFKKGGKHKRIHSVPTTSSRTVPPPPPPPPLPPPPSSIFNNIFKSVSKNKRFHSHSTAPPPPPPPPPSSITNRVSKTGTKSKRFNSITAAFSSPPPPPPLPPPMTPPRYYNRKQIPNRRNEGKPPLPAKTNSYYEREEFLPSGSQSPLIPMPPPPPPFKVNGMKFEVRGDFVRVRSTHSSVCSSPDRDDVDMCSMDGGNLSGPGLGMGYGPRFHPSPDVNAKAERFISRLKDEWRMEKKIYGKEKMG